MPTNTNTNTNTNTGPDPERAARAERVARRGAVLTALLTELGLDTHTDEPITEPLHTRARTEYAPGGWSPGRAGW